MRRSTAVYLILFLLLGALAWYMQQPGNPIKQALATSTAIPSVSSELLISPNRGPLSLVSIEDAAGRTFQMEKSGGQWLVKTGLETTVGQSVAESIAGQVLNLRIIRKLDVAPDPAGTGLDKSNYKIALVLADGSTFQFKSGKLTVTNNGYYAETQDGSIYILNKSDLDALTANLSTPLMNGTAAPVP